MRSGNRSAIGSVPFSPLARLLLVEGRLREVCWPFDAAHANLFKAACSSYLSGETHIFIYDAYCYWYWYWYCYYNILTFHWQVFFCVVLFCFGNINEIHSSVSGKRW